MQMTPTYRFGVPPSGGSGSGGIPNALIFQTASEHGVPKPPDRRVHAAERGIEQKVVLPLDVMNHALNRAPPDGLERKIPADYRGSGIIIFCPTCKPSSSR